MDSSKSLQIAIDGPVAAGKGTVSRLLAQRLGILYVDTGAMYRALTLFLMRLHIPLENEAKVCEAISSHPPEVDLREPEGLEKDSRLITVLLNGEDISWLIRTPEVGSGVSIITRYSCIRNYMVPQQRALADRKSVVMEGRDITTRVLPEAQLKIYLDANADVRVQRRHQQYLEKGEMTSLEFVAKDLNDRDYRDMHRELDPLTIAPDAWVLDTSQLTIPEVVEVICEKLKDMGLWEEK